jgi:tetratricopeptide (TPR) repeat protein
METSTVIKAETSAAQVSSRFLLHSFLLLLGRAGKRILEFYNGLFVLRSRETSRIYENMGCGFRKKGQLDKALAAYRELIKLNPDNAEAYFHLGRIYAAKGELELAFEALSSAIGLKPKHAEAHCLLGRVRQKSGDLPAAMEELMGVCQDKTGSPEEALKNLEQAAELMPDEPRYHQYLGFVYEGLGRHDRAVAHFKTVMELESAAEDDL